VRLLFSEFQFRIFGELKPEDVKKSMETATIQIAYYLERFRKGDRDGSFFGLLEMEHEILPELMAAFRIERDGRVREFLVEVIWQHRQPSVIPFLGEALHDVDPVVWKQALDGLVTLASPTALETLSEARKLQPAADFRRLLDEAIEQAESEIRKA
jgi:hypothetical protein